MNKRNQYNIKDYINSFNNFISISKILDVYLFLFPIFFIIFNFFMLHKNKYNKLVIIIDYIFQIINPITIGFFVSAFLLVINKEYPI